jgi:hypothetical protein
MLCPYCGSKVLFKPGTYVYKKYYTENVYVCSNYPDCNSYVGTHKRTGKPLGRLSNKKLRLLKVQAHLYFDTIWKYKKKKGDKKARYKGYKWLSKKLNLNFNDTHIGYFDEEYTKKVIELCKPYYLKLKGVKL